jgi:hypothetical protein
MKINQSTFKLTVEHKSIGAKKFYQSDSHRTKKFKKPSKTTFKLVTPTILSFRFENLRKNLQIDINLVRKKIIFLVNQTVTGPKSSKVLISKLVSKIGITLIRKFSNFATKESRIVFSIKNKGQSRNLR